MKVWRRARLPLVILVAFLATGCAQVGGLVGNLGTGGRTAASGSGGGRSVTVSVQPVREGPISLVLTYSGDVQPVTQLNVVPRASGQIQKLPVDVGSKVKAGDLIASLDRTTLEASVKQAEANLLVAQVRLATVQAGSRAEDIASAEAALSSAKARLAQVRNGATAADIQAAQTAVTAAQSALQKAQADLAKLKAMPTDDDLRAAQLDLDKAKTALWSAQVSRDGTCAKPGYQCQSANANVAAAQTAVDQAQRAYDKVKAGANPQDVASAEKAVVSAQAQVQSAQAKLAQLTTGPTAEDIAIATAAVTQAESQLALKKTPYTDRDVQSAQAQIAQAQAALDSAKAQLAQADIVAPFDGIVTQKLAVEGQVATAQTALVVLSSQAIEVALTVEEGRLGLIELGQAANLTVPAYPGQAFPAKITNIAPGADAKTHTFVVKVTPTNQDGRLRVGMFAEAKIVAKEQPKAILVPKEALVDRGGRTLAFVVADNKAAMREVKTGLSDDQQVEITSGLSAGEMVVIAGQASLSDGDAVRLAAGAGQAGQSGQPAAKPTGQPGQQGQGQSGQPGQQGGQPGQQRPSGTPGSGGQGGRTGQPASGTPTPGQ